jgi:hypothetical protein
MARRLSEILGQCRREKKKNNNNNNKKYPSIKHLEGHN